MARPPGSWRSSDPPLGAGAQGERCAMEQTTKGTVMTIDTRCGDDSSIFDTVTTETAIETPALDAWFDKHDVAEYLASELKHAYTKDLASLRVSRELTTEAQQATTHVPPTTVAEWVAQTRETGIVETLAIQRRASCCKRSHSCAGKSRSSIGNGVEACWQGCASQRGSSCKAKLFDSRCQASHISRLPGRPGGHGC
jgi:hypothetical protein